MRKSAVAKLRVGDGATSKYQSRERGVGKKRNIASSGLGFVGAEVLGPDAVAAGGEDAVGIEGVLHGFLEAEERVVGVGVGIDDFVHEGDVRAVETPAVLGGDLDHA